jgi:hypothetical protein
MELSSSNPLMGEYRIYLLDKNNRVAGPPEIETWYNDDAAIIRRSRSLMTTNIEVWKGRRLVAHIKASDATR